MACYAWTKLPERLYLHQNTNSMECTVSNPLWNFVADKKICENPAFFLETVLVYCLSVVTEPHLSDFSLEGEGEYWPAEGEGTTSTRDHCQPLQQERDGDIEREVAYHVELWRIWREKEKHGLKVQNTSSTALCLGSLILCFADDCQALNHVSALSIYMVNKTKWKGEANNTTTPIGICGHNLIAKREPY